MRRVRYNTKYPLGFGSIIELEGQMVTANGRVGILIGDGTNGNHTTVYMDDSANTIAYERDANTLLLSVATTVTTGVWYKIRTVMTSTLISFYLDGTLMGTSWNANNGTGGQVYVGLYTYAASVKFRNIKAWTLSGGAPA